MSRQLSNTEKKANSGEMNHFSAPFALRHITSDTSLFFNFSPSLIGRNEKKCHLILNHNSISRIHCALFWSDSEFFISDLGSRNGVYVNKKRARYKKLQFGDEIQVGKFQFEFIELIGQANDEPNLVETKQVSTDSDTEQEINLQDLAITPPPASSQDKQIKANQVQTADSDDNIKLSEIDDDELVKARSNYIDEEEGASTYQLNLSMLVSENDPMLKRIKSNDSEFDAESWREIGFVNYSLNKIKKASWQKRITFTVAAIVVFWGLKLFLFPGNPDYKIYAALQAKLNTVQSLRANEAGPIKWQILAANSSSEFQAIISHLEREASDNDRVKQELLVAARDCLPKVYEESQEEVSLPEQRLEKHLENVRLILENGFVEETNDNPNTPNDSSEF